MLVNGLSQFSHVVVVVVVIHYSLLIVCVVLVFIRQPSCCLSEFSDVIRSECSKDSFGLLQIAQKTLMVSLRWFLTSSSRVKIQRNAKKTPAAPRKCLKNVSREGKENPNMEGTY